MVSDIRHAQYWSIQTSILVKALTTDSKLRKDSKQAKISFKAINESKNNVS
jgi:hypothetical protein